MIVFLLNSIVHIAPVARVGNDQGYLHVIVELRLFTTRFSIQQSKFLAFTFIPLKFCGRETAYTCYTHVQVVGDKRLSSRVIIKYRFLFKEFRDVGDNSEKHHVFQMAAVFLAFLNEKQSEGEGIMKADQRVTEEEKRTEREFLSPNCVISTVYIYPLPPNTCTCSWYWWTVPNLV